MENNSNQKSGKWLQGKAFYGLTAFLVVAIVIAVAAIFNVTTDRTNMTDDDSPSVYTIPQTESTTDSEVNLNATGVPDERNLTSTTEEHSIANDLNRPYSGYYLLPINNKVLKDYSAGEMVYSETMDDWRTHDGIDVKGNIGDNVIAIQDGSVIDAYDDARWGSVIVIKHGNGLSATYCGVKASIKTGDKIEQGQVIGTLTEIPIEKTDEKHIHLETIVDGKSVDPLKALNLISDEPVTEK